MIFSYARSCMQKLHHCINVCRQILFPPFCAYCKIYLPHETILCDACMARVVPITSKEIIITEKKRVTVFAASRYGEPLQSLVLAKSSSYITASKQLGELIWQKSSIKHLDFDFIIPIPLHWTRYAYRGYNQAEEIAKVIAHHSGKPMIHALSRKKKTPFQSLLNYQARKENINDAFMIAQDMNEIMRGKKILLVDDVMTSGYTIKEAARMLYAYKPESINAIVACRAS